MNKAGSIPFVNKGQWSAGVDTVKKPKASENKGARLLEEEEGMRLKAEMRTCAMVSWYKPLVPARKEKMNEDREGIQEGFEVVHLAGLRLCIQLASEVSVLGMKGYGEETGGV